MYGFRCNTCGRLVEAGHGGILPTPTACPCCSAGVEFDRRGNKTFQRDNWEVLENATPERLEELGLLPDQVIPHRPSVPADLAADAARCQAEHDKLVTKEQNWVSYTDDIAGEWEGLDKQLQALEAQQEEAWDADRVTEITKVKTAMQALENQEFTARDAAHKAELHARIVNGPKGGGPAKHVSAFAREGTAASNKSQGTTK